MTRKYPFFTQIAYMAHFWNSVGPMYSPKKVANQNRCVGAVPVELNRTFSHRKSSLFRIKNSPGPKRIFTAEKKAVSVVLITNE